MKSAEQMSNKGPAVIITFCFVLTSLILLIFGWRAISFLVDQHQKEMDSHAASRKEFHATLIDITAKDKVMMRDLGEIIKANTEMQGHCRIALENHRARRT